VNLASCGMNLGASDVNVRPKFSSEGLEKTYILVECFQHTGYISALLIFNCLNFMSLINCKF